MSDQRAGRAANAAVRQGGQMPAEPRIGVLGDVGFELFPVVAFRTDPLAVTADRDQPLQALDVRDRGFQLGDPLSQARLQREHAHPDLQAGAQLLEIERLDEIVIRPGIQARDELRRHSAGPSSPGIIQSRMAK